MLHNFIGRELWIDPTEQLYDEIQSWLWARSWVAMGEHNEEGNEGESEGDGEDDNEDDYISCIQNTWR